MITGAIIIVLTGLAGYGLSEWWRLAFIRGRHDHEALWMAAIPPSDQNRVRELLAAICDAFMIPLRYRFRLRPSDDLQTFYQRNKRGQLGDSMEYENLAMWLEDDFDLDSEQFFNMQPCTVGTLVRAITQSKSNKTTKSSAAPHGNPDARA